MEPVSFQTVSTKAKMGEVLSDNQPKFHRSNLGQIKAETTLPDGINKAKMGDVLENIESSHGGTIDNKKGGSKKTLPDGINKGEDGRGAWVY